MAYPGGPEKFQATLGDPANESIRDEFREWRVKLIENINKLVRLKDGEGVHKLLDVDEEIKRTILPKIESQVSTWSMDVKVFKMEYKFQRLMIMYQGQDN